MDSSWPSCRLFQPLGNLCGYGKEQGLRTSVFLAKMVIHFATNSMCCSNGPCKTWCCHPKWQIHHQKRCLQPSESFFSPCSSFNSWYETRDTHVELDGNDFTWVSRLSKMERVKKAQMNEDLFLEDETIIFITGRRKSVRYLIHI